MEFPRPRPPGVSPEPGRGHSLAPTLLVAAALFIVALTVTGVVVLSGRIDRLEQRVEALEAQQRQP